MSPSTSANVPAQLTGQLEIASNHQTKRLPWLDMAKAYGMFLVYYGHFVEKIADLQGFSADTVAYKQYKGIYAFHMPLFFIISGFVYKYKKQSLPSFLYQKVLTRLVPVLFFNLVAIGIYVADNFARGNNGITERYSVTSIVTDLLTGYPFGNFLTWFLICLFTVELLNHLVYPVVKDNLWKRSVLAIATLLIGYYFSINPHISASLPIRGLRTWFFHEALVGFSFYQLGFILKQVDIISWFTNSSYKYIGLGLTLILTMATFNLNQGPFSDPRGMVGLGITDYGNLFWFVITAMTGSLFVILLALSLPNIKGMKFIGKNTLILLGMNFFFMDFTKPVIEKIGISVFDNGLTVTLFCLALTIGSFLVTTPLIQLLNKFLPQCIGRPKAHGPLLPALLR